MLRGSGCPSVPPAVKQESLDGNILLKLSTNDPLCSSVQTEPKIAKDF